MSESVKSRQPGIIVFVCGVIFSGLVLKGVDWLHDEGYDPMGFYVKFIIPVGAICVGLASGLGYAAGSRLMNAKLTKGFLWGMMATALVDYFAAQYVTYTNLHISPDRYSFWEYFRETCENMRFVSTSSSSSHEPGTALGMWGYAFKLLEITGFTFGYAFPSMALSSRPYCNGCQLYLKKHQTTHLNSALQKKEFGKMKKAERMPALQDAVGDVTGRAQTLVTRIKDASFHDTETALGAQDKAADKNAVAKVTLQLTKCPKCDAHHLNAALVHLTVDKKPATKNLLKLDKTELPAPAGVVV